MLLSFGRRKSKRAETRARDNEFPGNRRLCAAGASEGQSRPRVNEYFPMNEIADSIVHFPRNEKNEIALLNSARRVFIVFSKFVFQNTGNLGNYQILKN